MESITQDELEKQRVWFYARLEEMVKQRYNELNMHPAAEVVRREAVAYASLRVGNQDWALSYKYALFRNPKELIPMLDGNVFLLYHLQHGFSREIKGDFHTPRQTIEDWLKDNENKSCAEPLRKGIVGVLSQIIPLAIEQPANHPLNMYLGEAQRTVNALVAREAWPQCKALANIDGLKRNIRIEAFAYGIRLMDTPSEEPLTFWERFIEHELFYRIAFRAVVKTDIDAAIDAAPKTEGMLQNERNSSLNHIYWRDGVHAEYWNDEGFQNNLRQLQPGMQMRVSILEEKDGRHLIEYQNLITPCGLVHGTATCQESPGKPPTLRTEHKELYFAVIGYFYERYHKELAKGPGYAKDWTEISRLLDSFDVVVQEEI